MLEYLNFSDIGQIKRNLPVKQLVEYAVINGEGVEGPRGVLMVDTGKYTGRSPRDKFFVNERFSRDNLWIGPVNRLVDKTVYNELFGKVKNYYEANADGQGAYVFDGFCGADREFRLNVRIVARKAWQAIFVNNMFIRPEPEELEGFTPEFTIINASDVMDDNWVEHGLNSETFIIFNLERRVAIIGGTEYGGEMKKGIFSIMHYYLPLQGILSMHCSANVNPDGSNTALFFGLSGTGKTTLSTDPQRPLIGDDEHGWADNGIFNFEGGCYAKAIDLDPEYEPEIYNAIRTGALAENVGYDPETKEIDFSDRSKTENTRICYPIHFIENSLAANGKASIGDHPKTIIFLTCDAYGILPPVAKLTPAQAMYHFISGYTAKVAGTERGVTEPQATFSPCYGGPFLTLHPLRYAQLLKEKINRYNVPCYLVNTGWVGANACSGAKRISLPITREIIHRILDGSVENSECTEDPNFGVRVPMQLNAIGSDVLLPQNAWTDQELYHRTARELVGKFQQNFAQYNIDDQSVLHAGPLLTL